MNIYFSGGPCDVTITANNEGRETLNVLPGKTDKIDPSNSQNPFDSIGLIHNQAMENLLLGKETAELNNTVIAEELLVLLKNHPFKTHGITDLTVRDIEDSMKKNAKYIQRASDFDWTYPIMPNNRERFSPFMQSIFEWMGQTLKSLSFDNNSLLNHKASIIKLEVMIEGEKMTKLDKETSQVALSVFRHNSILYGQYLDFPKSHISAQNIFHVIMADVTAAVKIYQNGGGIWQTIGGAIGASVDAAVK